MKTAITALVVVSGWKPEKRAVVSKLGQPLSLPWQHNTFLTAKRKPARRSF